MPQQAERHLTRVGDRGLLFQVREPVLQVLPADNRGHELQLDHTCAGTHRDAQPGRPAFTLAPAYRHQARDSLLACRAQAHRGGFVPPHTRRNVLQECVDGGKRRVVQGNLESFAPAAAELDECREQERNDQPGHHRVADKRTPRRSEHQFHDVQVLHADADGERQADDEHLPLVEAFLRSGLQAANEVQPEQQEQVRAHDRVGNGEQQGREFRQQRKDNEDGGDGETDPAGRNSRQTDERGAERRIGHRGRRSGYARQQHADAVGAHRALHLPEVDRTLPAL